MSVTPIQPHLEPVRKSVTVANPVAEAFAIFTAGISRWWPIQTHSLSQERTRSCAMELRAGGSVYEIRDDGEKLTWAEVLAFEPPHRLLLAWHPGSPDEAAQEVEVRFTETGSGTLVELEHRDWQKRGEQAAEAREGYSEGWGAILGDLYARACREARV